MSVQDPHLQRLLQRSVRIVATFQDLGKRHSAAQLTWKPAPHQWSILECVNHLEVTSRQYHPRMRRTLEQTQERNLRSDGSFRSGFVARAFIGSIEPPPRFKVKAPGAFRAATAFDDLDVLERFNGSLRELVQLIHESDGWNLHKIRFGSPVTPLLRFNLGEALWLQVAHADRHLLQAHNVTRRPGFPGPDIVIPTEGE